MLFLCVFAGLCTGMTHGFMHGEKDECASHCHTDTHEKQSSDDHEDHGQAPHHHDCCHFPSADRTLGTEFVSVVFHGVRLEIITDHSRMPDSPVFPLDKPPLI